MGLAQAIAARAYFYGIDVDYAKQRWEKDDEIINRLLFGLKRHTISGRCGYGAISTNKPRFRLMQFVIDKMFWFQSYHCFNAINWRLYGRNAELKFKALHKLQNDY